MIKCPDCKIPLNITQLKYEGKTLLECPKCEDEFV